MRSRWSGVSYFTVNVEAEEGVLDWDWLNTQPAVEETAFVRHLHFDAPIVVVVDGRTQRGVILKPSSDMVPGGFPAAG
jgi:hypothetical protein